jgi:hypothetical protein
MIYGETGVDFTIFASCDNIYLKDHSKGFVTSCALAKNNVHIHVTNPTEDSLKYLEYLKTGYEQLYSNGLMTTSYDTLDISNYNLKQRKTFYTCNRFIVLPSVIKCDVLILDVDCLVMKHIDNLECDVGLFLRKELVVKEWNGLAGKVAAGAVYISKRNLDYIEHVSNFISNNNMNWYLDQVALYDAYLNFPNKNYVFFDNKFMDWEFKPDTVIWTGKGNRKSLNAVYTKKHKDFRKQFPIAENN